jgi:hypothetical protein
LAKSDRTPQYLGKMSTKTLLFFRFFFEFYFSPNIFFGKGDKGKFDTSFYIVVKTVLLKNLIFSCNVLIYQPEQPGWPEARPSPARSGLPRNKAR